MSKPYTPSPELHDPGYDPGLTQKYAGLLKRIINKDGDFNVHRLGRTWRDFHPYLFLISTPWVTFLLLLTAAFIVVNTLFTGLYMALGTEHIKNAEGGARAWTFLNIFFFSVDTLTTVGYGNMYPAGTPANIVSAAEALTGWLFFAIATGLLFGRFSKPSARFGFSKTMVVAPYMDGSALEFRVVNRRSNNLIEVEARVLLMTVEPSGNGVERKYTPLELERRQVLFFPLPWTVVHPIEPSSPLYGKTAEDLERLQAEVMIVVKGFDDTFGQTVHARASYRYDEIVWGAKFVSAFEVGEDGDLVVHLEKIGSVDPQPLPEAAKT
ncbi:MAG: hypothetical protein JOY54_18355 [Acidobacteriaceae bacterium]|nr:hypothetical protein [Acidobacteriaceae bacterium]